MIRHGNEAREPLLKGINELANSVKVTLGPQGKNVLLFNGEGKAYLTKDGVSVAKHAYHEDPEINAGMQLIRAAAAKTADKAGDSTTTSTILAQYLINEGIKQLKEDKNITYNDLKYIMESAVLEVVTLLSNMAKHITYQYDDIYPVALTASNNDHQLATIITKAFLQATEDGIVMFEASELPNVNVTSTTGMQFNNGMVDYTFVTNKKKQLAEYEDAYVILCHYSVRILEDIKSALILAKEHKKPIVVIADDFSDKVIQQLYVNHTKGIFSVLPIKVPGFADARLEYFKDIAAITKATVLTTPTNINPAQVGYIDKIVSTISSTTLLYAENIKQSESFVNRVEELKSRVNMTEDKDIQLLIKKQLSRLLGKVSMIQVGGTTEIEMKERYDRVEDAVCSVYSALEQGVLAGGGAAYYNVYNQINTKNFAINALLAPLNQLFTNAGIDKATKESLMEVLQSKGYPYTYNFIDNNIVEAFKGQIVDSAASMIEAYKNAISVAKMILSTECIIS